MYYFILINLTLTLTRRGFPQSGYFYCCNLAKKAEGCAFHSSISFCAKLVLVFPWYQPYKQGFCQYYELFLLAKPIYFSLKKGVPVKVCLHGERKRTTCFATLQQLQNELNSDVARFTTHVQTSPSKEKIYTASCVNTDIWLDKNYAGVRVRIKLTAGVSHLLQNKFALGCKTRNTRVKSMLQKVELFSTTTFRNLQQPDLMQEWIESGWKNEQHRFLTRFAVMLQWSWTFLLSVLP